MEPFGPSSSKRIRIAEEPRQQVPIEESAFTNICVCDECFPRTVGGERPHARGVCTTCERHYCTDCLSRHTTAFDKHVVLSKDDTGEVDDVQISQFIEMLDDDRLGEEVMVTRMTRKRMLNARHRRDSTSCWISGCIVLPDDILAVVDCDNSSLKLIDIQHDCIQRYYKFTTKPWDLVEMETGRLAITCPEIQSLALMNIIEDEIKIENHVCVNTDCHGIAFVNGVFVVSSTAPAVVQVLDKAGQLLQQLEGPWNAGPLLFEWPLHVAVTSNLDTILVSEYFKNKVIRLQMEQETEPNHLDIDESGSTLGSSEQNCLEGKASSYRVSRVSILEHAQLKYPRGMVYDDGGGLFLAGRSNVHRLTSECAHVQVALETMDGIEYAQCVGFSAKRNLLFVGKHRLNSMSNLISVFHVE